MVSAGMPQLREVMVKAHRYGIHLRRGGEIDTHGPVPALLVHGFVISSRYMVPLAQRLVPRRPVLAPDLPGFGRSEKPERVLDVASHADVLASVLDAVEAPRAAVIGNSFGCQVATELAIRHPQRVAALVLIGPTFDPQANVYRHALRLMADMLLERPTLWPLHITDYVYAGARRARLTLRHALLHRIEERLPRVEAPTHVVRGGLDVIVPRRWARTAAALAPRGSFHEVPWAPHALNYSRPTAAASVTERFLSSQGL